MSDKKQGREEPQPPNKRRVTMRQVAKQAGVSHVTVSRALRDDPTISEKTRTRVKHTAEEMGYRPDPMLSALANYRLANNEKPIQAELAWINAWDPPEKLRSYEVFDLYWQGALKAARKFGYQLVEYRLKEIPLRRLQQILRARSVKGILIPPDRSTAVNWAGFDWAPFAAVRLGHSPKKPPLHVVTPSQMQNSMTAFKTILKKGYERIGFVGEYVHAETFGAGFFWAQQQLPKHRQLPLLHYEHAIPLAELEVKMAQWITENRPDAIYTTHAAVPGILNNLGYRVPEDIALAASSIVDSPIDAGIDQNAQEIGETGVLALISLINDSRHGVPDTLHEYLIQGKWVDGSMMPGKRPH